MQSDDTQEIEIFYNGGFLLFRLDIKTFIFSFMSSHFCILHRTYMKSLSSTHNEHISKTTNLNKLLVLSETYLINLIQSTKLTSSCSVNALK